MITPKILKGFRDYLPEMMIPKRDLIKKLEIVFENYGFVPIDTPALEYTEILLGKGGGETDKQIFHFIDDGERDVALRFDLTVPLARFIAQHYNELIFPFKRYHIAPVWRGEKPQKGRFREFYQCDVDILGPANTSCDLEILLVIKAGLDALNAGLYRININHRQILIAYLEKNGLLEKQTAVLRAIDKIYKIGVDNILKDLVENNGLSRSKAEDILRFLNLLETDINGYDITGESIFNSLDHIKSQLDNTNLKPVDDLETIFNSLKKMNLLDFYAFNPAITRGLDYYTGIIFESFILDRINFGSVCSGGRYDNLTGLYSRNIVSGIGASFGLDRILSLMEDKALLEKKASKTDILIFNLDQNCTIDYQIIAETLRNKGIKTEIVYEQKKIDTQFKLADRKNIQYALIAGSDEIRLQKYNLKTIKTQEERKQLSLDEIIKIIKQV